MKSESGTWSSNVVRLLRCAALPAVGLLLSGCYTVNSFVDAPDADPGDGVCARALTAQEIAAGLRAPVASGLAQAATKLPADTAAKLGPRALERIARGDLSAVPRKELALAGATVRQHAKDQALPPQAGGVLIGRTPGLCTLRAAIMEANAHPWKSYIQVPAGTYDLDLPSDEGGGWLEITQSMRIQGSGAAETIVNGDGHPVFMVDGAADAEINLLTMLGGDSGGGGGALRLHGGTLEMEDVIVRDSSAFSQGGGILTDPGTTLTMRRVTVRDNVAAFGGGIMNHGVMWVYDSAILSNQGNRGGGIMNSGQMNLRNVTVSGNWADSPVAGVGGIWQGNFAVLNNVTITENTGIGNAPGSWQGGGIQISDGATTVLKNSIIAGNNGTNGPHDCVGTLSGDSKYNLIGDSAGCTIPSFLNTFVLDVDANLGVLAFNNGVTQSHAPLAGSPALNVAYGFPPPAADACEPRDQRGVPRPQGSGGCDMGAVEVTNTSGAVTGFMLVDASTNTDIRPLRNDDWLVLSQLPAQLSVRAIVAPAGSVQSVVFGFEGNASYRTENIAPYTLGGDNAGDYDPVTFQGGQQQLTATPYAADGGTGAAGASRTIRFNVLPAF
jgi:hypothetical protein